MRRYSPEQLRKLVARLSPEEQNEVADILEADERRRAEQVELHEQDRIWLLISQKVPRWDAGPLLWLRRWTKTEDTHALAKGTEFRAHFPEKEYIRVAYDYLLWEQCRDPLAGPQTFFLKTREMLVSWLVCGFISWMCQWHHAFWMAQSGKEKKANELIDYARTLYLNQPDWMKLRNPLVVDSASELCWKNGGRFMAMPSGVDQARMFHGHGYFQDESAFLPEAEASYNVVRPVVRQVICVSTDEVGWFSNECKL